MPDANEQLLREQIADCTRMMVMAELMDYSGHVSARIPGTDHVLIQPRDTSRAGLTPDDVLIVLYGSLRGQYCIFLACYESIKL